MIKSSMLAFLFAAILLVNAACDTDSRDGTENSQGTDSQTTSGPNFGGADTDDGDNSSGGFSPGTTKKDTVGNDEDNNPSTPDGQFADADDPGTADAANDAVVGEEDTEDPIELTGCVTIANCVIQCETMDQTCVETCSQGADPIAAQAFAELWTCAQANCVIGDPSMGDCMATQCTAQYTACISPQ